MFTRKRLTLPALTGDWKNDGPALYRVLTEYLLSLEAADTISLGSARLENCTIEDTVIGATTPAAGTFTDLTSSGNTVLGNASTDTLNVGNGGIIKDASGNVGIGVTPSYKLHVQGAGASAVIQSGSASGIASLTFGRTGLEYTIGTCGAANNFFTGTAAGDSVIAYGSGKLWIGTGDYDTDGSAAMMIPANRDYLQFSSAFHVTSATATGTTPALQSGTYTPTITGVSNVSSSTAYECQWKRVGNIVTVSGRVGISPTAAAPTATSFGVSLPIASNFANQEELGGSGTFSGATYRPVFIDADTANDRASFLYTVDVVGGSPITFVFQYEVL